jgi:hypothetical protein
MIDGDKNVLNKKLEPCVHATRLYYEEIYTLQASFVNKVCPFIVYTAKHMMFAAKCKLGE